MGIAPYAYQRIPRYMEKPKQALFWLGAASSVILGLVIAHVTGTFWMFLLIALAGCVGTYLSVAVLYMLAQIADNSDTIAENSKKQLLALRRLETLLQKTDAPGPSPESAPETH